MKLRPTGSKVLIQRDKKPEKTEGGLHLPDTDDEDMIDRGVVVSLGAGGMRLRNGEHAAPDVRRGDRVLFNPNTIAQVDAVEDTILVDHDDIYAVLS